MTHLRGVERRGRANNRRNCLDVYASDASVFISHGCGVWNGGAYGLGEESVGRGRQMLPIHGVNIVFVSILLCHIVLEIDVLDGIDAVKLLFEFLDCLLREETVVADKKATITVLLGFHDSQGRFGTQSNAAADENMLCELESFNDALFMEFFIHEDENDIDFWIEPHICGIDCVVWNFLLPSALLYSLERIVVDQLDSEEVFEFVEDG